MNTYLQIENFTNGSMIRYYFRSLKGPNIKCLLYFNIIIFNILIVLNNKKIFNTNV